MTMITPSLHAGLCSRRARDPMFKLLLQVESRRVAALSPVPPDCLARFAFSDPRGVLLADTFCRSKHPL